MVSELLQKYIWLVQTFLRSGEYGLSLGEIAFKWENRWGSEYPRKTFYNHRDAIFQLFGVEIVCDRTTNRYHILDVEDVADGDASASWLINTFTVNSLLSLGKERLSGRVSVENIPSGQKHLTPIMDAMLDGKELEIEYGKYSRSSSETVHVRPYAVKEYAKRWYLVGFCSERNSIRVYGLDRIGKLSVTSRDFALPRGFDVDALFSDEYGVYLHDDSKPIEIVFRTDESQAGYFRDLPLHPSQKELRKYGTVQGKGGTLSGKNEPVRGEIPKGEGEPLAGAVAEHKKVYFSIRVIPNDSLVMQFCSYGSRVEIVAPESFRTLVSGEFEKAMRVYR